MLDLRSEPLLDKHRLVGGCVRLPIRIDAARLAGEVSQLPASIWPGTDGRLGVHAAAAALFLRGYAPAEGETALEDRPVLDELLYAREIIGKLMGAQPLRCLLARLPAGGFIPPHTDDALYFWKTIRVHVPVESHDRSWMVCAGATYSMKPGEAWALNNNAKHAVWNAHGSLSRTHLICDFLPSPALLAMLADGERDLGRKVEEVDAFFASLPPAGTAAHR